VLKERNNIFPLEELGEKAQALRQEGKKITTLNGSFDLLHAGHLYIFKEAALQGDVLMVGLNSDHSIQQYKSLKRPLVPLAHRLEMVAALRYVDYVTWFEETTPLHFIERVRPDVHVNGEEYGENCIEAPLLQKIGARLHLVKRVPGLSTSNIVDKLLCDV
jgi:rfaE bifunctional protein nucleotidyltransferase chain/domain